MMDNMNQEQNERRLSSGRITIDIDYDRLADSIAKAIVSEQRKEQEKYSISREWMKFILYPVFLLISIGMACFSCFSFYKVFTLISSFGKTIIGLFQFIGFFMLGLVSSALCILSILTYKELQNENDRQIIATLFSNTTALVALIVALIALLHEI